jgi:hypothetical protein
MRHLERLIGFVHAVEDAFRLDRHVIQRPGWEALAAADEWAQRTGWVPGPADA